MCLSKWKLPVMALRYTSINNEARIGRVTISEIRVFKEPNLGNANFWRRYIVGMIILVPLILFAPLGYWNRSPWVEQASSAQVSDTRLLYFPTILGRYPIITTFGVTTHPLTSSAGLDQIAQAGSTWTRNNGLLWPDVEPVEGDLQWENAAFLDQQLVDASAAGLEVILIVSGTPEWAQAEETLGYSCGPIHSSKLEDFASFMSQVVSRYSKPPYNVSYYEIWNEPDVEPAEVPSPDSGYGCWGVQDDEYYGGGYYGEMLKVVYPAVKAASSSAKVLVGGLLLICDPRIPGACTSSHPRFLEGILHRNGNNDGGNYFDGVSFHAYDYYYHQINQYGNPYWDTAWNTSGPGVTAKANFIQETLAAYNITGKFLMNTEGAILCDGCENDAEFETTKVNFLVQFYTAAIAEGLRANLWYSALGWRNSGLLDKNLNPRPAYHAYKFAREILSDASGVEPIGEMNIINGTGVVGYKFQRSNSRVWVLWSLDGKDHTITLIPGTPIAIYDPLGYPQRPSQEITIGPEPRYVVWGL